MNRFYEDDLRLLAQLRKTVHFMAYFVGWRDRRFG
jgi:hypothetical protein